MEDLASEVGQKVLNLAKMGVKQAVIIAMQENSTIGQIIQDTYEQQQQNRRSLADYTKTIDDSRKVYNDFTEHVAGDKVAQLGRATVSERLLG